MKESFFTVCLLCIVLSGCGGSHSSNIVSANYNSMKQCLAGIKATSGSDLYIQINTKKVVVGKVIKTQQTFACEQKLSQAGATVYEGWYVKE